MDRNQFTRNEIDRRIEQWREQRAHKMAARLQVNSTKPRTISANVLGYTNYRQPITLQPGYRQQHEGPRFNHVDQRWNPNHSYAGYREHHSLYKQYHGDHRNHVDYRNHGDPRNHADHRNHGHGHSSYQQNGQKKGGHFSSHKSLYNDRKSTNKPSKRFSSSCSSINDNASKVGNQNGPVETPQSFVLNENSPPVPQSLVEADIISDISVLEPSANSSDEKPTLFVDTCSTPSINIENSDGITNVNAEIITSSVTPNDISVLEPSANNSDEEPTSFVDTCSVPSINIENSDGVMNVNAEVIINSVTANDHETIGQSIEPKMTEIDEEKLSGDKFELVSELAETVLENSTTAYECTDVIHSEIVTSTEEIQVIEQMASPEINSDVTEETLDLVLNLSYKPELENVEDTDMAVEPLALNVEVAGGSESNKHNNEEASIIRYDDVSSEKDKHLSKEIELVENQFSNISIANKDDVISDKEGFTPMKRERRQVLLDATNIFPSSTIMFAAREVRTNNESEIIVTPVRRSARLSTLTPVSAHKSICVQKLDELTPEVRRKIKFVQNPAIDSVPEC